MMKSNNGSHNMKASRRKFLQLTGISAGAAWAGLSVGRLQPQARGAEMKGQKRQRPLPLALASYTLRKFDLDQTLQMTRRVGLDAICLKSMHLPLDVVGIGY